MAGKELIKSFAFIASAPLVALIYLVLAVYPTGYLFAELRIRILPYPALVIPLLGLFSFAHYKLFNYPFRIFPFIIIAFLLVYAAPGYVSSLNAVDLAVCNRFWLGLVGVSSNGRV